MTDETPPPVSSPAADKKNADTLERLSDEALKALITEARAVLARREAARRKDALQQIRALAKEHGLALDVKGPVRKRGRPPKSG
jgi:hypothetical protein